MKKILAFLMLAAVCAMADVKYDLGDGLALRLGGSMRFRYDGYTQSVIFPNKSKVGHHTEYLRVRTRAWAAFDFGEDVTLKMRLGNRVHEVFASPSKHNNHGKYTWEFPDEVIFDEAYLEIRNLLDSHLTLTIGRQPLCFANWLIFSEGTPFDTGRSNYNDGITAKFHWDNDDLTLFSLYDTWKDYCVFINDRNRRLRSADIFTLGAYWTHKVSDALNWDMYYMFNDLDDKHEDEAERCTPADMNASIHNLGIRIFGQPLDFFDYSFEAARQFGRRKDAHLSGYLLDARTNFHLAPSSFLKPIFGLEFTRFSGDRPGNHRDSGWIPVMAQTSYWEDELLPTMFANYWTNLDCYRAALTVFPLPKAYIVFSATELFSDHRKGNLAGKTATGNGSHFGLLLNVTANYKVSDSMNFQGRLSHLIVGNYFNNGHDNTTGGLEVIFNF